MINMELCLETKQQQQKLLINKVSRIWASASGLMTKPSDILSVSDYFSTTTRSNSFCNNFHFLAACTCLGGELEETPYKCSTVWLTYLQMDIILVL